MKTQTNFIAEASALLNQYELKDYELEYILSKKKEDGSLGFLAYATSLIDSDQIVAVSDLPDQMACLPVPEWDFNVDEYLFSFLENGYELAMMSLDSHYGTWCSIDEWREELEHIDGLQKYLSYCQRNSITPELIANIANDPVNIMDLYKEINYNYEIIASTEIGKRAIVLAYNPHKDDYVTWKTTQNRKGGYDVGYYFSNYQDAFKNYQKRCMDLLDTHLSFEKNKTRPKEKNEYER